MSSTRIIKNNINKVKHIRDVIYPGAKILGLGNGVLLIALFLLTPDEKKWVL